MPRRRPERHASPYEGSVRWDERRERWRARITLPGGTRRERWTATRREGLDWIAAVKAETEPAPADARTLRELCELWWETVLDPDAPATTRTLYRGHLDRRILPALGAVPVAALKGQDVQRWIAVLRDRGYAPYTVHGAYRLLRAILKRGVLWEWTARNVTDGATLPRLVPATRITTPSAAEVVAILGATRGTPIELIVLFEAVYGLRGAEARGVRWCDVEGERGTLRVRGQIERRTRAYVERTKTRRERELPLIPLVVERLAAWPRQSEVFVTVAPDGRPYGQAAAHALWAAALREAGLPYRRPHDLRRGVATLLHDLGVPLETRKAIVGHLSDDVHSRYVEASLPMMREALERLGEVLA